MSTSSSGEVSSITPREARIPEPLSTAETVEIVSEGYKVAGPRIGSALVEANVLLTLAGAKGQTEFFIANPVDDDKDKIEALAIAYKEKGFFIKAGTPFVAAHQRNVLMVNVMNLKGLESASLTTHIPGFTPFDAASGWDGFGQWNNTNFANLDSLVAEKKLPFSQKRVEDVVAGLYKGYPDQAIYDFAEWVDLGNKYEVADTNVPHVSLYGGAEPNFAYKPEHANDPGIVRTVTEWGTLLDNFYNSSWHNTIKHDPAFTAARGVRENAMPGRGVQQKES